MINNSKLIKIEWVKAHIGISGNEIVDGFAKIGAFMGDSMVVPIPISKIKQTFKLNILDEWSLARSQTTTGNRFLRFINKPSSTNLICNKFLVYFLTGHGPFLAHLHRFKKKKTFTCPCKIVTNGALGDPDHYVFFCPKTIDYHLVKPLPGTERESGFCHVLKNAGSINKIINSILVSKEICADRSLYL